MTPAKSKSLHSRYNPQGEAERYVASLSLKSGIRFFILIEPGMGYIIPPLRRKAPGAKIVALHAERPARAPAAGKAEEPGPEKPDAEWSPESGVSVQDFLEAEIPDSKAAEIRILEWRPALPVFGEAYLALVEETSAFIKRADANERTLKAFGKSWIKNFFKNLDIIKNVLCPAPLFMPLVITGAGPGLEDALPFILEKRKHGRGFLMAASSSVPALEAGKIEPDLVISTDGSAWAKLHLYESFRRKPGGGKPRPLAAAVTAALPSQCENIPVLLISDGSLWQTLILKKLDIPFVPLPQRGTVSAAALDLAFALSRDEVFIAGMDLANKDIRSHARPYSFDRLMDEKAGRINPVYSQTYKRSSLLKTGGSYRVYAEWFKKQLGSYPKRLHALGSNNPVFRGLGNAARYASPPGTGNGAEPQETEETPAFFKTVSYGETAFHSRKALSVLEAALNNSEYAPILRKELGALLFPEREASSPDELISALRALSGFHRKENDGR